jgi:hypothetical protein
MVENERIQHIQSKFPIFSKKIDSWQPEALIYPPTLWIDAIHVINLLSGPKLMCEIVPLIRVGKVLERKSPRKGSSGV